MSIPHDFTLLKAEMTQQLLPQLLDTLQNALDNALPLHRLEQQLWDLCLIIGRQALTAFLDAHGTGDLGPTLDLTDGPTAQRLPQTHARRYVSIFGPFTLERTVYGSREGQAIDFVPLDNRWQLPASDFSYLLQDWDQALAVEQPFAQVSQTIARMLHLKQSVDSLEGMNRQMAPAANEFRELQGSPPAAEEGQFVVVSADCKGIVIRGQGTPTVCGGQRPQGRRANQKRMAAVGAVYTIDPYVRTAEEVVAALFRDGNAPVRPRPEPCHKRVWASLPESEPSSRGSIDLLSDWLWWEFGQRNPDLKRPTVCLCDGQDALWQMCDEAIAAETRLEILDLLHVTPRLWQAGQLLYGAKSPEVQPWVRQRVTQILQGHIDSVLRRLRREGQACGLKGSKKQALSRILRYLAKNRHRMRYDEYLRAGYPIASGVIEGACRHLIKDRMERSGMHGTLSGAQAMLDVRSVWIGGHWEQFQQERIEREATHLYPHRDKVAGEAFFALAS